ncbi:MAG: nuclear transport factor 2 family protein [Planctomycetota bacterium]|nr:MAG: nuclear transport factor 2 family protein [Planctomycetota bacterium]
MWVIENPWPPIVLCLFVAIVTAAQAIRHRSKLLWGLTLAMLLAAVACYVVDMLIVTERERLEEQLHDLGEAVRRLDTQRVLTYISPAALPERTVVQTGMALIDSLDDLHWRVVTIRLQAGGSLAEADVRANATVRLRGSVDLGHQPTRWLLSWRREGGQWKITRIRRLNPVTGEPMPVLGAQ